MKISKVIILSILILLIILGCETKTEDMDCRSPYTGNYNFLSYNFLHEVGKEYTTYHDTIVFEGSIELDAENDSRIIIKYRPDNSGQCGVCEEFTEYCSQIKPQLLDSGKLDYPLISSICVPRGYFNGGFIGSDSISFVMSDGALGGSWGLIVHGKRIE